MFEYNISNEANEEIFNNLCKTLEKRIPNLRKGDLLIDVDDSKTQIYWIVNDKILVRNSYYHDALFIVSETDIEEYVKQAVQRSNL